MKSLLNVRWKALENGICAILSWIVGRRLRHFFNLNVHLEFPGSILVFNTNEIQLWSSMRMRIMSVKRMEFSLQMKKRCCIEYTPCVALINTTMQKCVIMMIFCGYCSEMEWVYHSNVFMCFGAFETLTWYLFLCIDPSKWLYWNEWKFYMYKAWVGLMQTKIVRRSWVELICCQSVISLSLSLALCKSELQSTNSVLRTCK